MNRRIRRGAVFTLITLSILLYPVLAHMGEPKTWLTEIYQEPNSYFYDSLPVPDGVLLSGYVVREKGFDIEAYLDRCRLSNRFDEHAPIDAVVRKYDQAGNLVWEYKVEPGEPLPVVDLQVPLFDNDVLIKYCTYQSYICSWNDAQCFILDAKGKRIELPDAIGFIDGHSAVWKTDDRLIIQHYKDNGMSEYRSYVHKEGNLEKEWHREYMALRYFLGNDMVAMDAGFVFVGGYAPEATDLAAAAFMLDRAGELIWNSVYEQKKTLFDAATVTADGNVLASGVKITPDVPEKPDNPLLVKLSADTGVVFDETGPSI